MRIRDAVLDQRAMKADTAVYEKDLDIMDPISALWIEFDCPNGTTSNKANLLEHIVTKIEIVDGAEVLASLNQFELEALHFYKMGKFPAIFPSEWPSKYNKTGAYLLFGRYLWDQEFAFDPTAFKNPQLKITFNKAAVRAASDTTAFATGTNIAVTVVAKIMENMGGRPSKYLMPRSVNRWTSSTSGERRIELPTDYPYRMMLLRGYVTAEDINDVFTYLKITCDTDKFVMLNRIVRDLDSEAQAQFGTGRVKHDIFCSNGETVQLVFNKDPGCSLWLADAGCADIIQKVWEWSSEIFVGLYTHAGAVDDTDRQITMVEEGHAPYSIIPIPFGQMNLESTWFNPREYGKIEAIVTEGKAATCGILLEQVRPNVKIG